MIKLTIYADEPAQLLDIWTHVRTGEPGVTVDLEDVGDTVAIAVTIDLTVEPETDPAPPDDLADDATTAGLHLAPEPDDIDDDDDDVDEPEPLEEPPAKTLTAQIIDLLESRPAVRWMSQTVWEHLPDGANINAIQATMPRLAKEGRIRKVAVGIYMANDDDGADAA